MEEIAQQRSNEKYIQEIQALTYDNTTQNQWSRSTLFYFSKEKPSIDWFSLSFLVVLIVGHWIIRI
jgi:hypothetical protein